MRALHLEGEDFFFFKYFLLLCFKTICIHTVGITPKRGGDSPEFGFDAATVRLSTVNTTIRICYANWVIVADVPKLLQARRQCIRSVVAK